MQLTFSDRIVLHPDTFTEEGGMLTQKVGLPDGRKLASDRLGRAMVMTALLANEAAGALRLEVQQGKALFGLMRTRKLMAVPGGSADWPAGSLEDAIAGRARAAVEVSDLVQAVIGERQQDPAAALVVRTQRGMAERGLLRQEQTRMLKVFTVTHYVHTDASREAAAAHDIGEVRSLLDRTRDERPDLWKQLEHAVRVAINFMTQSSDD